MTTKLARTTRKENTGVRVVIRTVCVLMDLLESSSVEMCVNTLPVLPATHAPMSKILTIAAVTI
jgi:hypothetical protein